MTTRSDTFLIDLLDEIAKRGRRRLRRGTPNRILRRNLWKIVDRKELKAYLMFPHYWAFYIDQGTLGDIKPNPSYRKYRNKSGRYLMVWFVDPRDDPRTNGGTYFPFRLREVKRRRLSKRQFRKGLVENKARYDRNPDGGTQQYMRMSGSLPKLPKTDFVNKAMEGFDLEVQDLIRDRFEEHLRMNLRLPSFTEKARFVI